MSVQSFFSGVFNVFFSNHCYEQWQMLVRFKHIVDGRLLGENCLIALASVDIKLYLGTRSHMFLPIHICSTWNSCWVIASLLIFPVALVIWAVTESGIHTNRYLLRWSIHTRGCSWLYAGWWFGTFFIFPYTGNNHPNWLIFFRGVGIPPTRYSKQNQPPPWTCSSPNFMMSRYSLRIHSLIRNAWLYQYYQSISIDDYMYIYNIYIYIIIWIHSP